MLKRKNIFRSLLFILFLILSLIVFPLSILSERIFTTSQITLYEVLINKQSSETESIARMLASDLNDIQKRQYECLSNQTIQNFKNYYQTDTITGAYIQLFNNARSYIASIQNSNEAILDMTIYIAKGRRMLTSTSFTTYSEERGEELLALISDYPSGIAPSGTELTLFSTYPHRYMPLLSNFSVLMVTNVSLDLLTNQLGDIAGSNVASKSGFFLTDGERMLSQTGSIGHAFSDKLTSSVRNMGVGESYATFGFDGQRYLVTRSRIDQYGMSLCQFMPLDWALTRLSEYEKQFKNWLMAIITACILLMFLAYAAIYYPISNMRKAMHQIETGDYGVRLPNVGIAEFREMYIAFNHMVSQIHSLIEQEYKMKLLMQQSELQRLQFQIDPHFLYNTFFLMRGLVLEEDSEKALQLCDLMGQYLRDITKFRQERIPLGEEIRNAYAYAQIQQLRYASRIRICFSECPGEVTNLSVPRMIVQPLIENALKHGLKDKLTDGEIKVTFKPYASRGVDIVVEDNGGQMTEELLAHIRELITEYANSSTYNNGVALGNISQRVSMTYHNESALILEQTQDGGLRCLLRIREEDDHVQSADC